MMPCLSSGMRWLTTRNIRITQCTHTSNFRKFGIPISMHGDGTPTTGLGKAWGKMADGISWHSCLCRAGQSKANNFIIIMMLDALLISKAAGNITQESMWTEICWSLYWCFQGVHPDRNAAGVLYRPCDPEYANRLTPLAGGFFLILWVLSGDLDFMWKRMKLANPSTAAEPCSCCGTNSTAVPWTDWRVNALWVARRWTITGYNRRHPQRHMLFKTVPGVSVLTYITDVMHCKNLGPDPVFLGSILRYLTHYLLHGSPHDNLKQIWAEIRDEYKTSKTQTRYGNLSHNMIHPPSKKLPQLKGKAAEIKHLISPLLQVARKYLVPLTDAHTDMIEGLEQLVDIERMLHAHKTKPRFPPQDAVLFRDACFRFCQCQDSLIRHFHADNTPLFNQTVKSHYICHLGLLAAYINPSPGGVLGRRRSNACGPSSHQKFDTRK